ncbi:hypothetical protein LJ707_05870 [Mucilaginibacter sp. UR6-1]|uniref:hypothetical protein n=1 Tax=Mucilaginibacter sp. UR6-1 TaxID=1435643 RepID=UPI001E2C2044|nr:hypothetical protein [Mucilaginibacter sp. UR6-1]MCC8408449.1 hypothetical protein [Mucilaginibacter sp. UR6-1]
MNTKFFPLALNIISAIILICLCCDTASAQRRSNRGLNYDGDPPGFGGGSGNGGDEGGEWGVALQAGFDSPRGELGASYKGAPLVGISILKYYKSFTFGITLSRHSYKPAVDDIGVEIDMGDMGSYNQIIKLTSNRFTGFYAGAAYNIGLAQGFKCYGGVNFGGMTSTYGLSVTGTEGNYLESYTDKYAYFAPKLGVEAAVGGGFSIGVEGKYNIFMVGSTNSRTGGDFRSEKSVAGVATLTYSF